MSVCHISDGEEKVKVGTWLLVHLPVGRLADSEWMRWCCPFFDVDFGICYVGCWRLAFIRGSENTDGCCTE